MDQELTVLLVHSLLISTQVLLSLFDISDEEL